VTKHNVKLLRTSSQTPSGLFLRSCKHFVFPRAKSGIGRGVASESGRLYIIWSIWIFILNNRAQLEYFKEYVFCYFKEPLWQINLRIHFKNDYWTLDQIFQ
jgi:hypothetical protein